MKTLLFALLLFTIQDKPLPEYGTIENIKQLRRVYVAAEDTDARNWIVLLLGGYEGVEVVNNPKDAELILEYRTLTRDVAANRAPYKASMSQRSEMRAYVPRPDGSQLVAWSETETFDVTGGMVLGASNEANLTQHFVKALQKVRGEKTYSMRALYSRAKKAKKANEKKR